MEMEIVPIVLVGLILILGPWGWLITLDLCRPDTVAALPVGSQRVAQTSLLGLRLFERKAGLALLPSRTPWEWRAAAPEAVGPRAKAMNCRNRVPFWEIR